jgi:type IV secretion system protein VirB9
MRVRGAFSFILIAALAATYAVGQETPKQQTARTVQYHAQDIVPIHAKVNFTTLLVLPASEEVIDAATGDKEFWIVDVVSNFVFVHPAKEHIESNLNLITSKGNVYSFTLTDVSGTSTPVDLKVIIQTTDVSSIIPMSTQDRFVPAEQLQAAKQNAENTKVQTAVLLDSFKSSYPSKLVFDFNYKQETSPFFVQAIYHDDKFTYIKVDPRNQEKFAVYEMKDGKPDLITCDLQQNGVYVVTHIVDQGYLRIGKKQLDFDRKGL